MKLKKVFLWGLSAIIMVSLFAIPQNIKAEKETTLRVATFNIAAGKKPIIKNLNEALEKANVEVVGLQEVDINTSRNNYDMLQSFLDENYFEHKSFYKSIPLGTGEYGNGIVSKYEFTETGGAALPSVGIGEARAYVRSVLEKDGKQIAFYSTHLTHENQAVREQQMKSVLQAMDQDPIQYKILTGDFNTDQDLTENYPLMRNYNAVNGKDSIWYDTYNGNDDSMKYKCIDNIVTTRNINVTNVKMVNTGYSDHNLLYADCELLNESVPSRQLLDILVEKANLLDSNSYTEESFANLEIVLNNVSALDEKATQSMIDDLITNLENAIISLESSSNELFINDNTIGSEVNQISYSGSWGYSSGYPNRFYEGDEHWYNFSRYVEGSELPSYSIKFKGTGIELYGEKQPNLGIYKVYLDGKEIDSIDAYASSNTKTKLYSLSGLAYQEHILKIELTKNKNSASGGNNGEIDYAKVLGTIYKPIENDNKRYLIPKPLEYYINEGEFTLTDETQLFVSADNSEIEDEIYKNVGQYLLNKLESPTGFDLTLNKGSFNNNNYIQMNIVDKSNLQGEAYELNVTSEGIVINAGTSAGLFRSLQTLRQLFPAEIEMQEIVDTDWKVPNCSIYDKPEYDYRGMMLDVSRHYFTVDQVKRQIDLASQYKINKLHMHLSDDQGWRLEMKGEMYGESLSKLKTIGATTSTSINGIKPGQYTQDDFKELVAYASERYIEIIPEFDMPGHTWAALVSLNFLNSTADGKPHSGNYDNTKPYEGIDVGFSTFECRNEKTYEFIEEVIKQVAAISPSKYIHIGGDEAHSTSNADYVYFMNRVTEIAQKYGKTPIGWQNYDKAVTDKENTVTQFWETGNAKLLKDINYVVSPADHAYMDMKYDGDSEFGLTWATMNPIDDSYNWDPTDYGSKDQIVGIEAPLWAETLSSDYAWDYMIYPRLMGHAEIGWTPKEARSWDEYKTRLIEQKDRMTNQGIQFRKDESIWPTPYEPVNAEFEFNENSGTTTKDTLDKYIGKLEDVSWCNGIKGSALKFDGTGYVDLNISDLKGNWTTSLWLNKGENLGTDAVLIGGSQGDIKLEQWKGTKKLGITEYGVADYTFDYIVPENEWVYLTFVCDDNGTTLYVNGERKDSVDAIINGPAKRLGASSKTGLASLGNMVASVDQLSILNTALSKEKVKELYDSSKPVVPDPVNKESLKELIDEINKLSEKTYTPNSWDGLEKALEKAEVVFANDDATQKEVDDVYAELDNKLQALEKKADKKIVTDLLKQVKNKDLTIYTSTSVESLNKVVVEAEKLVEDDNATQKEVDAMVKALENAINNLEIKEQDAIDKSVLIFLIERLKGYDSTQYTKESWDHFKKAFDQANKVKNLSSATEQDVKDAIDNLEKAEKMLVKKTNSKTELVPETKDQSNRSAWMIVMLLSVVLIGGFIKKRYSKK